ncbi:hypothetical protein ONS96_006155 [Cadophora gregata f. sp. sojae]|nr:hypothetical protein ONS96_006155 [Cadophora gregata f. sp. sojae]
MSMAFYALVVMISQAIHATVQRRALEQVIREPIKNANWHLIRRLKIAEIMAGVKDMAEEWERAWFIQKEMKYLDTLEEYKALVMYINEIRSTGKWFGTRFHFPNLVISNMSLEYGIVTDKAPIPLKWQDSQERVEVVGPKVVSVDPPSTTPTTTLHRDPKMEQARLPSIIGIPIPSEGKDSFSTPSLEEPHPNAAHNSERFRPSFSLQNNKPPIDPTIAQLALDSGVTIEPNYEGELTLATIRDRTCPAYQNASVYITNVDPAWTTAEIFDCVHEGGIYKYSRQGPTEFYESCAVTLTFKHRRAAVNFLHRAKTVGVYIKGQGVKVVPSRHHCWGIEEHREKQTRVLQIEGPEALVDANEIEAELHKNISFSLVKTEQWVNEGRKFVNFHFENIFGQSRAAVAFLARTEKYKHVLTWRYAEDPCAIDRN